MDLVKTQAQHYELEEPDRRLVYGVVCLAGGGRLPMSLSILRLNKQFIHGSIVLQF